MNEFDLLVDSLVPKDSELKLVIQELLERKKAGEEMDNEPRISLINEFLEEGMAYYERTAAEMKAAQGDQDRSSTFCSDPRSRKYGTKHCYEKDNDDYEHAPQVLSDDVGGANVHGVDGAAKKRYHGG